MNKRMKTGAIYYLGILLFLLPKIGFSQNVYFPPLNQTATWETTTPESLGWCTDKLDSLYDFLETENSKAFIVLKDGKIVLEKYFGTFTKDSNWYWASAGKSLTSLLIGKAQEEGFLSINDSTSKYLGAGWTNCTPEQEIKITIRNQITMTSGLDDGVTDNHCTDDTCLIYKADAGTRWAYHNAPYTLLEDVINAATGQTTNNYTTAKVKNKIGMTGTWLKNGYDNVYFSTPRSFARYGLLAQNNFIWNTDTILADTIYTNQMVSTSQTLNLSYGYLWWLNGKSSYMLPSTQIVFPGSLAPNAPTDMFAAIGKNGQIISISKSKGLVVMRMGEPSSNTSEVPTDLCNKIWFNLNKVICNNNTAIAEIHVTPAFQVYPNPASETITINQINMPNYTVVISNLFGQKCMEKTNQSTIDISQLQNGIYLLTLQTENAIFTQKFIKK